MDLSLLGTDNAGFMAPEGGERQETPPNNTIYIQNLNEKVPIEELKDTLFNAFEEYGEVLDVIIAKRNIRMRGQAFIVFRDINSAMEAKRRVNGRTLYGKTMRVSFARQKSDIIAKLEGTFQLRDRPDDHHHQKYLEKFVTRPQQQRIKVEREKNILKKQENVVNPPNHILFCQGLTPAITAEMLTETFIAYPGLVDVRLAPKNFAFIEYEDEFKAGNALVALNETKLGEATLQLTYAKK